jgi:hypothetical protein
VHINPTQMSLMSHSYKALVKLGEGEGAKLGEGEGAKLGEGEGASHQI